MKVKYSNIIFIAALSLTLLLGACGKPSESKNDSKEPATPTQTAEATTPLAKGDYTIIPLTSGKVSPIGACSYDLLHTVVTIQIYDSYDYEILEGFCALIDRYDKLLSRTI